MSHTFIQYRARIIEGNCRWYQKLDASYFEFYEKLRNTLERIFRPFKPAYDDFNVAYANLNQSDLSEETMQELTIFLLRVNQTIYYTSEYASRFSMMQYGMSLMMPDYLSPVSMALKNAVIMPLSSIFNFFTMTINPPSDSCVSRILSKFVPTYEPYAKKLLESAKQGISAMPSVFLNVTTLAKSASTELRSLTNKIINCSESSARQVCVDEIVSIFLHTRQNKLFFYFQIQKYVVCENQQPCTFEALISKPMMEISMSTMELQKVYSSSPMVTWSMELNDKINELKATC